MRIDLKKLALFCLALTLACAGNSASPASASDPSAGPGQPAASTSTLNWVRYTDSAEGAFSMEVPVGWQVQGGMYRFGYFDVRWMMDARSLDGKVVLRIDDVDIPPYTLPGPNTGRDGQAYTRPQQFQMMVSNYREAQPYADLYAKHRFAGVCKSMTARQPGWTPTMPAAWHEEAGARTTEASLAYDCPSSDGPRIVALYLRTALHPQSGLWQVDPVISIIATPDRMALVQSMAQHMIDSWQETPQWAQYQQKITQMGLQQVMQSFGQFMQQMRAFDQARSAAMNQQVAHFESQQNAQTQQVSSWGETLTGLTKVTDPQTGTQFQIFSGPKANYYSNGNGVTINSNLSPGAGFHQLTPTQ